MPRPRKKAKPVKLGNLELVAGALGAAPIPILGEVAGTYFYARLFEDVFPSKAQRVLFGAAMTGATRVAAYTQLPFYKTAYDAMLNLVM